MTETHYLVSIVIAVYFDPDNEEAMVAELARAFGDLKSRKGYTYDYEVIFINDGSTDGSWEAIQAVAKNNPHVRGLNLSNNFGQHAAIRAGLDEAKGDIVITMDSDLEDHPSLIPKMIAAWEDGNLIVRMQRIYSENRPLKTRVLSNAFYWVFNKLCDTKLQTGFAEFRLMDRRVVDALKQIPEHQAFYPALLEWMGFGGTTIPYVKGERPAGESAYNIKRQIKLAWNGISSFSTMPLWLMVFIGGFIKFLGFAAIVVLAILKWSFAMEAIGIGAFILAGMAFATGLIIAAIGIVALYLGRVYQEVQRRPHYLVWERTDEE